MDRKMRLKQVASWGFLAVFVAGFFVSRIGMLTGAIMGLWFVESQKAIRGILWMLGIAVVLLAVHHGLWLWSAGMTRPAALIGAVAIGTVAGVLPFLFHRLIGARLPVGGSTLPFPLATMASVWIARAALDRVYPHGPDWIACKLTCRQLAAATLAPIIVWLWNSNAPTRGGRRWMRLLAWCVAGVIAIAVICARLTDLETTASLEGKHWLVFCIAACGMLTAIAFFRRGRGTRRWKTAEDLGGLLQSPETGMPLRVELEEGRPLLRSESGEQFPIRDGVPDFVRSQDLAGANGKYRHLYETIGGFYDDTQRVVCALSGLDRDAYVRSYLDMLEIRPGDAVLETSVGTGLNFRYLPTDVRRFGLDLSEAMLRRCEENLRRWELSGDIFLGNAEALPFAGNSFDVVFHVGGINFFNDRERAIHEMIRVAKPGSRILIADETEEHVKELYERGPITGGFYKNRAEAVTAPVDLIPTEMEEVELQTLAPVGKNRFYVVTFRKPSQDGKWVKPEEPRECLVARMNT